MRKCAICIVIIMFVLTGGAVEFIARVTIVIISVTHVIVVTGCAVDFIAGVITVIISVTDE